jgi:hypothetical protein
MTARFYNVHLYACVFQQIHCDPIGDSCVEATVGSRSGWLRFFRCVGFTQLLDATNITQGQDWLVALDI